jgi:tryptophan synthase alpha chain
MGVTGTRAPTSAAAPALVERVRAADPSAMVGVGLGVSNGAQAYEVTQYADAVIVGSALVKALLDAEDAGSPADLSRLRAVVAELAGGVRGGEDDAGTSPRLGGLVGT